MTTGISNSNREGDSVRSPRFSTWLGLLVFSVITLVSSVESARSSKTSSQGEYNQGVAITLASISFALAFIAVIMHLNAICSVYFVGTKMEGIVCFILMGLWISIVTVVTDPSNDLAVDKNAAVSNGNLYYFSWFGLVFSVILKTSFLRDVYHLDLAGQIQHRAARLNYWSGLMLCGFVVMGTSANTFHNQCKLGYKGAVFCNRTVFAITLGTICAAFSLFVVAMKIITQKSFFVVEGLVAILLALAWSFGVGYITGEDGPGAPLGNLYYFTWASFLVSCALSSGLYEDYLGLKSHPSQNAETTPATAEEDI